MKRFALLIPLLVLFGCEVNVDHDPDVEYLLMPGLEDLVLTFSSAVRVDNTL